MTTMKLIPGEDLPERTTRQGTRAVVQFSSSRCGHCRVIAGTMERIASEFGGFVDLYRIDTDRDFATAQRWNILSSPTLVFMENGVEVERAAGPLTLQGLSTRFRALAERENAVA